MSVGPGAAQRHRSLKAELAKLITAFLLLNAAAAMLEPYLTGIQDSAGSVARARRLIETEPRPDVLFMGSSLTALGFDPLVAEQEITRATGAPSRALNVGIFGGSVDMDYLLLKNVIRDDRKPEMIVYGVTDRELNSAAPFDDTQQRRLAPLLGFDDLSLFSADGVGGKLGFLLERLLPLYRDRAAFHDVIDPPAPPNPRIDSTYHGFYRWPGGDRLRFWEGGDQLRAQLRPYRFDGRNVDRLRSLIELAKARSIKLVLVNMPTTPLQRSYWASSADLSRYVAMVASVARDGGVPLLDLYQDPDHLIPMEGYLDSYHLNGAGAEILTRLVAERYLAPQLARRGPG